MTNTPTSPCTVHALEDERHEQQVTGQVQSIRPHVEHVKALLEDLRRVAADLEKAHTRATDALKHTPDYNLDEPWEANGPATLDGMGVHQTIQTLLNAANPATVRDLYVGIDAAAAALDRYADRAESDLRAWLAPSEGWHNVAPALSIVEDAECCASGSCEVCDPWRNR